MDPHKAKPIIRPEKSQTFLWYWYSFVLKNTWITRISLEIFFRIQIGISLAWSFARIFSWCFADFPRCVRLYTLCTMVPQWAVRKLWSIGSFLHPYESLLPFTPVLTINNKSVFPLPRRYIVTFLSYICLQHSSFA